jgi:hypothetical protein
MHDGLSVRIAGFFLQECWSWLSGTLPLSVRNAYLSAMLDLSVRNAYLWAMLDLSVRNASFVCQQRFICLSGTLYLSVSNALFVSQECLMTCLMLHFSIRNTL